MKKLREGWGWYLLRDLILLCGLVLILFPLYLVLTNSLKTLDEASRNFFALPTKLNLENFKELFSNDYYWVYLKNSLLISCVSMILVLILVPAVS